jgi:hypothetical protein
MGQDLLGLLKGGAQPIFEFIRQGQQQGDKRLLVSGVNGEDIAADALGFQRLFQQTVSFGFFESGGYRLPGEGFQCEHDALLYGRRIISSGIEKLFLGNNIIISICRVTFPPGSLSTPA